MERASKKDFEPETLHRCVESHRRLPASAWSERRSNGRRRGGRSAAGYWRCCNWTLPERHRPPSARPGRRHAEGLWSEGSWSPAVGTRPLPSHGYLPTSNKLRRSSRPMMLERRRFQSAVRTYRQLQAHVIRRIFFSFFLRARAVPAGTADSAY